MKVSTLKNISVIGLAIVFCFGCSAISSLEKKVAETSKNNETVANKSPESVSSSPCSNRFYPVEDGLKRNFDNTIGGKTTQTMDYKVGDSTFTEVTALKDITVKHVWKCTSEGLTAADYGSGMDAKNMKVEPKHVSGVTLPREDEIKIGKMWTTVYTATGTSDLGAIEMTVTLNNKIVSLDDEVKTSGGTFKAVKIEIEIDSDMKFGGNKMPVPKIKSAAWFAPEVGMVKSTGGIGGISNTMSYTGKN
jgi:hypothetical protein